MCMISYYPEIDGNFLYIRTAVFRFRLKKYALSGIDEIKIYFGHYKAVCIKLKLKGRKRFRRHALYSMGYRSIRLFVEELRSKEVKVECEPYRLDGKMKMYPVREMWSNYY